MRKSIWASFTHSCILWGKSIRGCIYLKLLVISFFNIDLFVMIFTEKRKIFKSGFQIVQVFHWNFRKKISHFATNYQTDPR